MRALAIVAALAGSAAADDVVFDFTASDASVKPIATRQSADDDAKIVKRFPAPSGKTCRVAPKEGELLPTITVATRPHAKVYLIDYCPGGVGAPRTRRLIAIDDHDKVTIDRELPQNLLADELLSAIDVDGKPAVVLTASEFKDEHSLLTARLIRVGDTIEVVGVWVAVDVCYHGETTGHRVTFAKGKFTDTTVTNHCYYPP